MGSPGKYNNTIQLAINTRSKYLEGPAAAAILPGSICKMTATGGWTPVSAAAGLYSPIIAVESKAGGGGILDQYEIGAQVYLRHLLPGDIALVRVDASADPGTLLSTKAAGAGILSVSSVTIAVAIFVAAEHSHGDGFVGAFAV